jgi:hypothetical protein
LSETIMPKEHAENPYGNGPGSARSVPYFNDFSHIFT